MIHLLLIASTAAVLGYVDQCFAVICLYKFEISLMAEEYVTTMVVTKKFVIARKYLEKLSFLFKSYCAVRTIYTQSGSCHFHVEIRKYIEFENLDEEGYLYNFFFTKQV